MAESGNIEIPIWPGSGSSPVGKTPFGFYDADATFIAEAPKVADWCARRLGYPIMDVELQDVNFYACFEEAITEYSNQVNQFQIADNLLTLQGNDITTTLGGNISQRNITPNLGKIIEISQQYGSEALVGGNVDLRSGSFTTVVDQQDYDLTLNVPISASNLEIKRVFHFRPPAINRYFDPFVGTGLGSQQLLSGFGFGDFSPAVSFLMTPIYADLLRLQAIEFNDMVRKSQYSFHIVNNKIKIFPRPTEAIDIYFQYIDKSDRNNPLDTPSNTVADLSNAPYNNILYQNINHPGRKWIYNYALALAKEMLGYIRGKYQTIPIPGAEQQLNAADLLNAALEEKDFWVQQLREMLEKTSRRSLLEARRDEGEFTNNELSRVPLKIYIA